MNFNLQQYYRALIGTIMIFIGISFASVLLVGNSKFSYYWWMGIIIISVLYIISLYINWKFIIWNDGQITNPEKEEKE